MSAREKKLLIFFATAGFLVLNFLGFNLFQSKKAQVKRDLDEANRQLTTAEVIQESREQVADEMDWLARIQPEPAASQDVQTKLQQFCQVEAEKAGLTVKSQKLLPSDTAEGLNYHRVKSQFTVTGTEEALYTWFDRLNVPDQLRIATNIRLSPDKEDDTKIDCTAVVEQWFVPLPPA